MALDLSKLRVAVGEGFLFCIGASMLVLAPVFRGGNRHAVLLVIEWLGLALLVAAICMSSVEREKRGTIALTSLFLAASPLLLGLLHLIPVPFENWRSLPGRQPFVDALEMAGISSVSARPLSLVPIDTKAALLAALPPCAMFVAAQICLKQTAYRLLQVAMWVAALEAAFGLLQAGKLQFLFFGAEFAGSSIGTFANSNHFANLLVMLLPFALLYARAKHVLDAHYLSDDGAQVPRRRNRHGMAQLLPVIPAILIVGIVASRSRMGIATAVVAGTLAVGLIAVAFKHTLRWRIVLLAVVIVIGGMVLMAFGIEQLSAQLGFSRIMADAAIRSALLSSSLAAAQEFWPVGSGLGTFIGAYLRFQPASIRTRVEYAHNDYVQFIIEGGMAAACILLLAAFVFGRRALHLLRALPRRRGQIQTLMAIVCGFGLFAIVLHSLIEFPMHIPANAVFGALLAGVFLRAERSRATSGRRSSRELASKGPDNAAVL